LKEVINAKAQQLLGKPIVGFEQSKVDPLTGDKVLFQWWFLEEQEGSIHLNQKGKPLIDVFNEKDNLTIIISIPTYFDSSSPELEIKNGMLKVKLRKSADSGSSIYTKNNKKASRKQNPGKRRQDL
jgi:HSP20 family molecular chaperone IbpA